MFDRIKKADYDSSVFTLASDEAVEFIKSLLVVDSAVRPTAETALKSKWLKKARARRDITMLSEASTKESTQSCKM